MALTAFLSALKRVKEINMAWRFQKNPVSIDRWKTGFCISGHGKAMRPPLNQPDGASRKTESAMQARQQKKSSKWQNLFRVCDRI